MKGEKEQRVPPVQKGRERKTTMNARATMALSLIDLL